MFSLFLAIMIGLVTVVILVGVCHMEPNFWMWGIAFLVGFISFFPLIILEGARELKTRENMTYDPKTKTLTLNARVRTNGRVLELEELKDYKMTYHPPKQVYSGATVGGVHMGGVHEIGNYYTAKTISVNKWQLKYTITGDPNRKVIEKIILPPDLIKEAKATGKIRQFMDENDVVVLSHPKKAEKYNAGLRAAINTGRTDLLETLAKSSVLESQLNHAECVAVKKWICGKNI